MRNQFIKSLIDISRQDLNTYLLTGDLGYSVLDKFIEFFPDRFINVGVAEQNMMSIAAGLASCGKKVFAYSIANFATLRCLEQIRNDICYHNANVTVVSLGAGFAYGTHGYTHWGLEDIGCIINFPNLAVLSPADPKETEACMNYIHEHPGPSYLRLGRGGESNCNNSISNIKDILKPPYKRINVLVHGAITIEAEKAVNSLYERGLDIGIYTFPLLKPFPHQLFKNLIEFSEFIFTIEEHASYGGLCSIVAKELASLSKKVTTYFYSANYVGHAIGSQAWLQEKFHLDARFLSEDICEKVSR